MKREARLALLVLGSLLATSACSNTSTSDATATAGTNGAAGTGAAAGTGGGAGTTGAAGTGSAGTAGAAGTTGAAGTGAAGSTGAAGTGTAGTGTAGTGGTSLDDKRPSAGCTKAPTIAKGQYVMSTVSGRNVWVRLPPAYDPAKAYPVVFVFKGCGAAGRATFGFENVAGNEAIIAQIDFAPGMTCYDTADGAKFVDLPVFDALLAQLEGNYCVDRAHEFSVGFSSGAWMTFLLGCQRGDVLRGIGTVAGGFKPTFFFGQPQCKGNGLTAFMVSDLDDHENPFFDEDNDGDSVEIGLNHWLNANGCAEKAWTMQAGTASEPNPAVCRSYSGCGARPVRLCLTKGMGHSAQEQLSFPGFWALFKQSIPQ